MSDQLPNVEPRKRALLLVNPQASRFQAASDVIRSRLGEAFELDERDCRETKLGELLASQPEEYEVVFVAGGDGTIHYLLGDLIGTGLPLGIIPLGTANDLARTLNIPAEPATAIDALLSGECHKVDVGMVNGQYFANVASIGLGADVVREMNKGEKSWLGVFSYPLALFRAYRMARPLKVRLTTDAHDHEHRVLQLGVGNGHTHGGGLFVSETVSITDGKFDVYCVVPPSWWRLTAIMHALLRQQHRGEPTIKTFSAERVDIKTSRKVNINVDGELSTTTPARFEIKPMALSVLTPASWTG